MSLIDGSLNRRNSIRGKEEGGGSLLGSGRRDLAGLTLDAVLGTDNKLGPSPTVAQITRTLLDVIRDDPEGGSFKDFVSQKDKKSWRSFKERLRRRRESQAWTSTVPTPTSDIPISNSSSQMSRQSLTRFHSTKIVADLDDEPARENTHRESPAAEEVRGSDHEVVCDYSSQSCSRSMMMRRTSSRFNSLGPAAPPESTEPQDLAGNVQGKALRPQISRHNSTRLGSSPWSRSESARLLSRSESSLVRKEDTNGEDSAAIYGDELGRRSWRGSGAALQEERQLSAREAAASQEAAEAAAAAAADGEEEGSDGEGTEGLEAAQPKRMSLMDLLEETDRQMGFVGSRYVVADEEDEEGEEEEVEEEEKGEEGGEYSCCVCMVRHKGSAFIPCGHTFCKMCSRELMVARGNCPLCNKFILEILDIF